MRTFEERQTPQSVTVFKCDRCGAEIPVERMPFGADRLAQGSQISGVHYGEGNDLHAGGSWLPLAPHKEASRHSRNFEAAHVDLCSDCTAGLLIWFADGRPR